MAKGISAVIATIMLLMITVALIGVFYVFGNNLLGTATTSANGTITGQVNKLTQTVSIVAAKCVDVAGLVPAYVSLSIQNTGSNSIPAAAYGVYIDGLDEGTYDATTPKQGIAAGAQFYAKITSNLGTTTAGTPKTIKVVAPAGPVQVSVTCGA